MAGRSAGAVALVAGVLAAAPIVETHRVDVRRLLGRRHRVHVPADGQALEKRDQVDELGDAQAVGVARHDRLPVGAGEAGTIENHRVRRQDRLGEVLRGMLAAHARQLGTDVLRIAARCRKVLSLDRVALVALEIDEDLSALHGIAAG